MSAEVERIKSLVKSDLLIDAVEIPTNHRNKNLVYDDMQDVLARFDDNIDYAHFIIRVKRSTINLPDPELSNEPQISIDSMVNETLGLLDIQTGPTSSDSNDEQTIKSDKEDFDPEFLFENAKLLVENKDFALARNIYQSLVKKGVKIADCLGGIGYTYDLEENYEKAIQFYQEAIAYSSKLSFHQSLAAIYIKNGKDDEAIHTLIHALGIPVLNSEEKFELYKTLGNCYTRLRDYPKAELHYKKAFDISPESDSLQVNVGSLALQKNDLLSAVRHYQRALEINPKNDKAVSGVGMVYLARGQVQNASTYFIKSLRMNIDNLPSIYNLVKCAYELKKFDDAAEMLQLYIKSGNSNSNIIYSYAGILFHLGQTEEAKTQVAHILTLDPTHAGALELNAILNSAQPQEASHV